MNVRAILTDIEGTTSSIAFVAEVLFPYARARLADFVRANPDAVAPVLEGVRQEAGDPELDVESCIAQLLAWHDADRKIGPLKTLQGMIWADGYAAGALSGYVYPDAVDGLRRWHAAGIALYVYSSGSVAAQKLLFGHSDHGDLTPLFAGYFDTAVGGKREPGSYAAIAREIGLPADAILFLSDVAEELDAAHAAGMPGILLARGDAPADVSYPVAASFATILAEDIPA
ncbi:acireductone synthase [Sphingomonas sp.]|uniref:acireductone synthase n=1 Tax=Sphingomonas sp. TaxID=28214 RepID=UPI0031CDDE45